MYLGEHENNPEMNRTETLGHLVKSRGYSELFQKAYLVPMCASIWSCSPDRVMDFSAFSVLSFYHNYCLLQLSGHPQWLTVKGRSYQYVKKIREELELRGTQIKTTCDVHSISTSDNGCTLFHSNGLQDVYDGCVMAVPAPDALKMLGKEATYDEMRILGAFQYIYSDVFLHHDKSLMPQNPAAWSAWNFMGSVDCNPYLTYWLNALQPKKVLLKWPTVHLIPSVTATAASLELDRIQGKRGFWFSGAFYHGNGSDEDAIKAGMIAAHAVLGRSFLCRNPKQMVPSWREAAARFYVNRFLRQFISAGCLIFLEDGGSVLTFEGSDKRCNWKTALRVHSPRFYWKVAVEADLGLADAFINGDISVVDKNEGLVNLFRIIIANMYLYPPASGADRKSYGWWSPLLFTAVIASGKYFYRHVSRRNTVRAARQNIARHYDLARVEEHHELLDIGCGWGSPAIEAVKKTGCRYTGITLAEEQFKLAQQRVKEAGLQDRIRFLLCDYRQLPSTHKYDTIISWMLEHVGDEHYEDFFRQCESLLADNGVVVVQTISVPDERFEECKRTPGFTKEYVFPGGCLPSLSRITSVMATASRLWQVLPSLN